MTQATQPPGNCSSRPRSCERTRLRSCRPPLQQITQPSHSGGGCPDLSGRVRASLKRLCALCAVRCLAPGLGAEFSTRRRLHGSIANCPGRVSGFCSPMFRAVPRHRMRVRYASAARCRIACPSTSATFTMGLRSSIALLRRSSSSRLTKKPAFCLF